jgi:hypothetical protein
MSQTQSDYVAVNAKARLAWRLLYEKLEKHLKRHQPADYVAYAIERLREVKADARMFAQIPPHFVIHSIEANCAYTRGQNKDPVTPRAFAHVINAYHDHKDPFLSCLIGKNVQHFMIAVHRQQLELQYHPMKIEIARAWELFVSGDPVPTVAKHINDTHGLTPLQWLQLCFLMFGAATEQPIFLKQHVQGYQQFLRESLKCDEFLKLSSQTPSQIRERFRNNHVSVPIQFHSLIRSSFLDYPLIDLGDNRLTAPIPELLVRHGPEGLYRLAKAAPNFDHEFGQCFQRYIGCILREIPEILKLLDDDAIKKAYSGRHCDYIAEFPDHVFLVECKAVSFTPRLLLDDVILKDNSTRKVGDALEQIEATANGIREGAFVSMGIPQDKPIYAAVATYGDIPLANSDWFFQSFVRQMTKAKLTAGTGGLFRSIPAILSARAFELLCLLAKAGKSVAESFADKDTRNYYVVGDWETFLVDELCKIPTEIQPEFQFVRDNFVAFFRSLNLSHSQDGTLAT